jgi:hypothetical protein
MLEHVPHVPKSIVMHMYGKFVTIHYNNKIFIKKSVCNICNTCNICNNVTNVTKSIVMHIYGKKNRAAF